MSNKSKAEASPPRNQRQMLGGRLNFAASEAYKLLRTNLMFSIPSTGGKIIGVTSALRNEGKSTTSINLAYSIAQTGNKVLLIDADMRLPSLAKLLGIQSAPGLSNLLAGLCSGKEALSESGMLDNLYVIPSGDVPPNPSELLGSKNMNRLVELLAREYDYVIFDLPPITAVSDGLVISKLIHGMIVVVRQDYCDRRSLAETMRQLEFLQVKVLGFVMTRSESASKGNAKYKKAYGPSYPNGYHQNDAPLLDLDPKGKEANHT